jgi:hypothetical protein
MALQRTRRPRFRSGRSLRSLGSPLNARSLGSSGMWSLRSRLLLVPLVALSAGCVRTEDKPLGGKWFIRWEFSQIPESGGVHPYLHRRTGFISKRVEENTWRYRYLGDDCVLYVAGNSNRGELMAACGDRRPVVIAPRMSDFRVGHVADGDLKGDPIMIGGAPMTIREIKRKAGLTSGRSQGKRAA